MATLVIGISECRCTKDVGVELMTYALGSCIGVGAYDPEVKVAGMLHFLLPESRQDTARALTQPACFADTGIPLLIRSMETLGASRKRIKVRLAGGAQMLHDEASLAVGKRNYLAARRLLWQMGVLVEMEAVGGTVSRNLGLRVGTGEFWVQTHPAGSAAGALAGAAGTERLTARGSELGLAWGREHGIEQGRKR